MGEGQAPTPRTPTPHSSGPVPRGKLSSTHFLCLLPEMFSAPVNITWMAPSLRTQEGGHDKRCHALTHSAAGIPLSQHVLHSLILFNNCLALHCPKVLNLTCLLLMVIQVICTLLLLTARFCQTSLYTYLFAHVCMFGGKMTRSGIYFILQTPCIEHFTDVLSQSLPCLASFGGKF